MDISLLQTIKEPIFYITNEVGKGVGLEKILPNYHIICLDDHPMVDLLQKEGVNVFCLERALGEKNILFRSAGIILGHPLVLNYIKEKSEGRKPYLLFFKPQKKIEILAEKYGFGLLGSEVALNRLFEDKVEFFKLCQKADLPVVPGEVSFLRLCEFEKLSKKYGQKFVLQFGRGWAGNTTFFIENERELKDLQAKFGQLEVKISQFVFGRTILNNAVVSDWEVLVGPPAIQIKAEEILTSTQGGTGGRQWPAPVGKNEREEINRITKMVGSLMAAKGYRGFFGLDFIQEEKTGKIYLSENNARLTASVPFYTKLELRKGIFPLLGFHLLSFLKTKKISQEWETPFLEGGEIVVRNIEDFPVKVEGEIKTGIYNYNLEFKKETYFLETNKKSDFWLETVAKGRIVNPEIEIAKLDTLDEVCDSRGCLNENYRKIIEKIREKLRIKK